MKVKEAKRHIDNIKKVCNQINKFWDENPDVMEQTGFLTDAVGYLCDYRALLEKEIEKADLRI